MKRIRRISVVLLLLFSILGSTEQMNAQQLDCASAPPTRLTYGDSAQVVDTTSLPLLSTPDLYGEGIGAVTQGTVLTVLDGPLCFEGQQMWQVIYNGQVGWVTENAGNVYVLQPTGDGIDVTPVLRQGQTQFTAPGWIAYQGVSFYVPTELGERITAQTGNLVNAPQSREFTFDDLQADERGTITFQPGIHVWNRADYQLYGIDAEQTITQLETLIDGTEFAAFPESLPFLPDVEGGQTFAVQARALEFQNGRGVRYITHFSSGAGLLYPYDYWYTFQGLTDDRRHYVAVIIPLTSELPEHGLLDFSNPTIYDEYLTQITVQLDEFTSSQ